MNFKSALLAAIIPALCAMPAFAQGHTHPTHSIVHGGNSHPLITAIYCDTDNDFFNNGGFSRFANNGGHSLWTGGLTFVDGDGVGVLVNTQGFKANSFQFDVKTTGNPGLARFVFWFWNTSSGTDSDSAVINGTSSNNSAVTATALNNGTVRYTYNGATDGTTGLPLVQVGFQDFGADDNSTSPFTDTITNFLIDGVPALPDHASPEDLCFFFGA